MFTPRLYPKNPSYISLPASLRSFITSTPHLNVERPDSPNDDLPPIRHVSTGNPIKKYRIGRIGAALDTTDYAIQRHLARKAKAERNAKASEQQQQQQPAQAMASSQEAPQRHPISYLRNGLIVFHKRHARLSPAELSHCSAILRRYAERLEWLRQERDRAAGLGRRGKQTSVPASYYRGGTSRAVVMRAKHVPPDPAARNAFFLHIMGSPDPNGRQLNGMGAGISSLSKICLVSASEVPGADVDYTFVGVGIEGDETDYAGNCGNMSAAVGPFAFNEKMLGVGRNYEEDGEVSVTIFQTNTKKFIRAKFQVVGGQARVDGETSIDGVSGLGTGVVLDFLEPEGSKTGTLLPTGNSVDTVCGVEASCVDAANPCVFVRAEDMGLDPTILPNEFLKEKEALAVLERIRTAAAVKMGLCKEGETPPRVIPKIGIVSPPVEQTTLAGTKVPADQLDLVVRFISDAQPHRAIPVTAALCTAAAAKTEGSIVQQCLREHLVDGDMITIGHPSGRIQVNAQKDEGGHIASCSLVRTARRIWDGRIYWSEDPNLEPTKSGELEESFTTEEQFGNEESLANNAFIQQDDGSEFDIEAPRTLSREAIAQLEAQLEQVEKDLHKGDLEKPRP